MQFNSIEFLFAFLPIFLILYFALRTELLRPVLILGSLLFYALSSGGNYWWVALLIVITLLSYLVQRSLKKQRSGWLLGGYLTFLCAVLIFFKLWQGGKYLPAGMSFYMFQIAAILIDVYRGQIAAVEGLSVFSEQVALFPKLLSGPIVDPKALSEQAERRSRTLVTLHDGLQLLILGLAMKVILANNLGGLWAQPNVIGYAYISTPAAWIALCAYAMQLYLDFWGYSLMAIGLGKMLGYDLPENFIEPYSSKSIGEFYRRWHATLGAWFKTYIYIPLGGNRKGWFRTILNIMVVWLFTGLWHGIGGNYLLWAGFICFFIINERLWLGKVLKKIGPLSHLYVVFVILLSWIPFAIGDWEQMVIFTGRLFGQCGTPLNPLDFMDWVQMYAVLVPVSLFMMTPLPRKIWEKIRHTLLADILLFVLFWVVVYYIATAAQNPFLYFQY